MFFILSLIILLEILLFIGGLNAQILLTIFALVVSILATLMYATASPTVSVTIISGKTRFNPSQLPGSPSELPNEFLYDTRVRVTNLSRFPMKAYINLNLKADGEPIFKGNLYCSKEYWHLYPHESIEGHFGIQNSINQNSNVRITMSVEVRNPGIYQYLIEYPTRNYHFDLNENKWFNEDFGYYI